MRTSLLLALALATPASAQTTWYVDAQGTPPGTGTVLDPYTSLQYALDEPSTIQGDTLLVAPGLYEEKIFNDKNLTVRSEAGPLETFIRMPPGLTGFTVVFDQITSGPLPRLEGFSIIGRDDGGTYGVQLVNGAQLWNSVVSGHRILGGPGTAYGVQGYLFNSAAVNCTIVDNDVGAIDHGHFGDLFLNNCVLEGNGVDMRDVASGLNAVWSSWVTELGGPGGSNNLEGDPGLWNPGQGDPRLGHGSVCIDSGNPSQPLDPDGSPPDRGAVPYDQSYLPPATIYCTSKLNTGGCQAAVSLKGSGAASVSSNVPMRVEAVGVMPNVLGLLFYGTSGRRGVPFMGGFHCVEPPVTRTAPQGSGDIGPTACQGLFIFDFNAYLKTPAGSNLSAGDMVQAQYWYRDPSDPFGSATSDAVEFPVGL